MYKNRTEAAQHLVKKLEAYRNMKNATVVTIPRGGLPMGYVLSKALNLPLDIVLSKKIAIVSNFCLSGPPRVSQSNPELGSDHGIWFYGFRHWS